MPNRHAVEGPSLPALPKVHQHLRPPLPLARQLRRGEEPKAFLRISMALRNTTGNVHVLGSEIAYGRK